MESKKRLDQISRKERFEKIKKELELLREIEIKAVNLILYKRLMLDKVN